MEKKVEKKDSLFLLFGFVAILVLFVGVSTWANKMLFIEGFSFIIFFITNLLLPGIALCLLINIKDLNGISFIGISIALGYAINIAEYFALFPFGLQHLTKYLVLAVFVLSTAFVIVQKNRLFEISVDFKLSAACGLLLILFLVVAFWSYNMPAMSPQLSKEVDFSNDTFYWIGNTSALTRQFPPMDPRLSGQEFNYYYFSNIQIAIMHRLMQFTGISIFRLSTCFSYFLPGSLLVIGSFSLFYELTKKRSWTIIATFILLFTAGFDSLSNVSYVVHLILITFGFDYGLGILFLYFFFIIRQYKSKEIRYKDCFVSILLFLIITGTKATFSVAALGVTGVLCVWWLLKERNIKKSGLYGATIVIVFILTYVFIVSSDATKSADMLTTLKPFYFLFDQNGHFANLFTLLTAMNIPTFIVKILLSLLWFIYSHIVINMLFLIGAVLMLSNIKTSEPIDWALFITTIVCNSVPILTTTIGLGQVYFAMAAFPVSLIFAVNILNRYKVDLFSNKSAKIVLSSLLTIQIIWAHINFISIISSSIAKGIENFNTSRGAAFVSILDIKIEEDPYNVEYVTWHKKLRAYVTNEDFEAYDWIRKYTEKDAVILMDRSPFYRKSVTNFDCGGFTERQMYVESQYPTFKEKPQNEIDRRYQLSEDFFYNKPGSFEQLRSEGVDYIIRTKWLFSAFIHNTEELEIIYQNDTVVVYRVLNLN